LGCLSSFPSDSRVGAGLLYDSRLLTGTCLGVNSGSLIGARLLRDSCLLVGAYLGRSPGPLIGTRLLRDSFLLAGACLGLNPGSLIGARPLCDSHLLSSTCLSLQPLCFIFLYDIKNLPVGRAQIEHRRGPFDTVVALRKEFAPDICKCGVDRLPDGHRGIKFRGDGYRRFVSNFKLHG